MDNKDLDNNLPEEKLEELSTADDSHVQNNSTVKSKSGTGLSLLAIILSLAALAACAYLYLTHNNQSQQLLSRINSLQGSLQNTSTDLTNAQQRIQKNIERQHAELLPLKKSLAQLHSITENTQQTWSIEEVHQLLQLAVDQLSLAGNIEGALAALNIADRRIASNGDPELQPVRQQIANDIASLHQIERIDLAGTLHRLNAVSESIDHLPVVHFSASPDNTDGTIPDKGNTDSVWKKISQDLSGLVKIRRIDQPAIPLLPPDQQVFLRENTKALLMTARLALLQHDGAAYSNSLQQAKQWITRYFNTESHNTQWAVSELEKLAAVNLEPQLPDINGSLSQLEAITMENQR
jgi:uroporphyrin-3 C-methyltransferase